MEKKGTIKKEDIAFLFALAAFMVFSVIRFYDRAFIAMGITPLPALRSQNTAIMGTGLYFVAILLYSLVALSQCAPEKKKQTAYLLTVMSIIMVPAFLPENYFGVIDIYSAMLGFLCVILLYSENGYRFAAVGLFIVTRWDLTAAVTWGVWILAFIFYLTNRDMDGDDVISQKKKKNNLALSAFLFIAGVGFPGAGRILWHDAFEPRYELTGKQALMLAVFLIPFALMFIRLIIILASNMRDFIARLGYYCLIFAALPGFAVWFLRGDFYRAIFYLMTEAALSMLILLQGERVSTFENPGARESVWDNNRWLRIFLLLYLACTVFFFMYGKPLLLEEQLLDY